MTLVNPAQPSLFFCAVGGSGMLPLAMMMKARGASVRGSDRSRDQGRTPEKFAFIEQQGIALFPQDGSGVDEQTSQLIVSAAVEETVPDVQAAKRLGIPIRKRAELLAELLNSAQTSVAVAGTSGKSTTTGMTGWILQACGLAPTVVNGAVMKNFATPEIPFASASIGDPGLFVAEVDESDGSIALYNPTIAVLNNVALDHKSMDELRGLFSAYLGRAQRVVVNKDNAEAKALAPDGALTFSLHDKTASLYASNIAFQPDGATFGVTFTQTGEKAALRLPLPGLHNISNALAAIGAALAAGVAFTKAAKALESFAGIARRMEVVGTEGGVTVIDDFAHNPDKIAATLSSLRLFPGRLLILFQPHGYGPLRLMRRELAACFASHLTAEDLLYIPDALYLGGTANREVTSADLAADIAAEGRAAIHLPSREDCADALLSAAKAGDRIVVMGARDDTLPELAKALVRKLRSPIS